MYKLPLYLIALLFLTGCFGAKHEFTSSTIGWSYSYQKADKEATNKEADFSVAFECKPTALKTKSEIEVKPLPSFNLGTQGRTVQKALTQALDLEALALFVPLYTACVGEKKKEE
jgi:hypothetical protein